MELDVTAFVQENDMFEFAHSAFEGGKDAGKNTYNAALRASDDYMFVDANTRDEIVSWVLEFGAWEVREVAGWTDVELNALLLQFIAGDARRIQEIARTESLAALECWEENEGGRLSYTDPLAEDATWSMYIG